MSTRRPLDGEGKRLLAVALRRFIGVLTVDERHVVWGSIEKVRRVQMIFSFFPSVALSRPLISTTFICNTNNGSGNANGRVHEPEDTHRPFSVTRFRRNYYIFF